AALVISERYTEPDGKKRKFVTLAGTVSIGGKPTALTVKLVETDGKGAFHVTGEVNRNDKADAFFADPGNPVKQTECPVCSGN
ncbi:hypothetical protein, partial [Salmonella enterica]|uniref:hypothetical protein n=1 Tax=Salmonella enterica TaxID=28901 RepID=UPI003D2BCD9D